MGVEGALDVSGTAKDLGSLAVKMASPGLACILLSATIIGLLLFFASDFETTEKSRARSIEAEGRAKAALIDAEANVKRAEANATFNEGNAKMDEAFYIRQEADAKIRLMEAEARLKEAEARRLESLPTR